MPAPIMIPPSYNPWQQMLPNFVQVLAQQMIQEQFRKRQEERQPPELVPSGGESYYRWDREQEKYVPSNVPMPTMEKRGPTPQKAIIYGTGPEAGKTDVIWITPGKKPVIPKNFTLTKPPQLTLSEREIMRRKAATKRLEEMDPEEVYMTHGFKVNEDKTLYKDPVNDAPVKLPPFHKVMGKRGQIKAAMSLGEQWADAKELLVLLKDPKVKKDLKLAESDGLWNRVGSKWSNQIQLWMQKKGIGRNSKTATAIARMQRLASEERKTFLGTAMTVMEMKGVLGWMPSAGDSLDTMLNKVELMGKEGEQRPVADSVR